MLNIHGRRSFILKLLYLQQALCLPLRQDDSRIIPVYDQRQSGKYNIQISLKNVAIIEVDKNEFVDDTIINADEYYYDDDDMTIKPWMIATTTTTEKSTPLNSTPTKEPIVSKFITNNQEVNSFQPPDHISRTNVVVPTLNLHSSLFPSSTRRSLPTDNAEHLVVKPDIYIPKAMQENIPQLRTPQSSRLYTTSFVPNRIRKQQSDSILKIISTHTQPLVKKDFGCKINYVMDGSGNCLRKRRSSFLESLYDMLQSMRVREM